VKQRKRVPEAARAIDQAHQLDSGLTPLQPPSVREQQLPRAVEVGGRDLGPIGLGDRIFVSQDRQPFTSI